MIAPTQLGVTTTATLPLAVQLATVAPIPPIPLSQPNHVDLPNMIHLSDKVWQGGERNLERYRQRGSAAIHGVRTPYSSLEAAFHLPVSLRGIAVFSVEGLDAEGQAKTLMRVTINGVEIFSGLNPLPDDDLTRTQPPWATTAWYFDASLVHAGYNVVRITNLAQGPSTASSFLLLDYTDLTFGTPVIADVLPMPAVVPTPPPHADGPNTIHLRTRIGWTATVWTSGTAGVLSAPFTGPAHNSIR